MKKSTTSLFSTVAFVLFVIWGVGTLLTAFFPEMFSKFPNLVENILRVCSLIVMVYCAYSFYTQKKSNKLVFWLFWVSILVAVIAVVRMFF